MLPRSIIVWTEDSMKKAVVVGSGAGGATVAKELQGSFEVTVLEEGRPFRPFTAELRNMEIMKKSALMVDARLVRLLFPAMRVRKSSGDVMMVNGVVTGGTTTICTANAVRKDEALRALGINLDREFKDLFEEVPMSSDHQRHWHAHTRQVFDLCSQMGLQPVPTQKMAYRNRCAGCGRCVFGCQRGAKWGSRVFLDKAVEGGAKVIAGCSVKKVVIHDGSAIGVEVAGGPGSGFYLADLVVLAAGGFGTPAILRNSGIECQPRLFVDPVLCVAAKWEGSLQDREIRSPCLSLCRRNISYKKRSMPREYRAIFIVMKG